MKKHLLFLFFISFGGMTLGNTGCNPTSNTNMDCPCQAKIDTKENRWFTCRPLTFRGSCLDFYEGNNWVTVCGTFEVERYYTKGCFTRTPIQKK